MSLILVVSRLVLGFGTTGLLGAIVVRGSVKFPHEIKVK